MVNRKITWTKRATLQLNSTIEYIRKDSGQHADSVKLRILNKISEIAEGMVVHRKDPYKKTMTEIFCILKY